MRSKPSAGVSIGVECGGGCGGEEGATPRGGMVDGVVGVR